ncbi:hypothetical protein [Aliarcobacter cryaerophilus]|uniref:hypothetical protein n=1 Tax=Aliarcobacter cryaerophilus TaxID=28198 RepID=UPI0021B5D5A6|nr:hypothetical protein [Aliarcobacter cryaerophilus]MCT7496923.1 hypothetical protein [Aliarcobacter cryaerophilus]
MQIKKLKVKDKWNRDFGILTYDVKKDTFHFKYDDDCEGYDFSDINAKNGREFEQSTIFNVFSFDDSYVRSQMIEKYNISNLSDNEMQWFFKEHCAKNNSLSCKGFYFEFRENTPCDFVKKVIDSMENFKLKKYL